MEININFIMLAVGIGLVLWVLFIILFNKYTDKKSNESGETIYNVDDEEVNNE